MSKIQNISMETKKVSIYLDKISIYLDLDLDWSRTSRPPSLDFELSPFLTNSQDFKESEEKISKDILLFEPRHKIFLNHDNYNLMVHIVNYS
jgi:hypothetical protein